MTTIFREFKEFALKGNVIDLAVGVIIGGAFGAIVHSLVSDILTPLLGLLTGGINFMDRAITLREGVGGAAPLLLKYGSFIQNVIDFLLIAFVIFLMVKTMNRLRRRHAEPEKKPEISAEEKILIEIRDLLKKG
jgi:large conductance mechanosensitive channel